MLAVSASGSDHPLAGPRTAPNPGRRRWRIAGGACLIVVLLGTGSMVWLMPRLRYGPRVAAPAWAAGVREGRLRSEYCITCHAEAGARWRGSDHQLANHRTDRDHSFAAFDGDTTSTHAADYRFATDAAGQPTIEERRHDGSVHAWHPSMMIAWHPLRQPLIETRPGSYQASEVAWDPEKEEWFGVFGDEERNPGEWGHWTGQGMNWNSMCARCHMTGYDPGYDEAQDRYRSTWVEQGIGCVQCHGPMTGHETRDQAFGRSVDAVHDAKQAMQTCAACHARAEDLTVSAPPGATFDNHFRLQLATDPHIYYPDGQVRDEDFEWGSFQHSKMAAAGVTCLDCHDAHTGRTRLPFLDNQLCLQCHAAGNERNAPPINPTAHSFHAVGSAGNGCVACHMPETTYMRRDPRRDHGFIIPDPRLTRDLGIPNACARCHADRSLEWTIAAWDKWYGAAAERTDPRRDRAHAVARAEHGDVSVVPRLLRLLGAEKTPGWRASLLELAAQLAPSDPAVIAAATTRRDDTDPLLRAAAVRALSNDANSLPLVREALKDRVRLVRLDAAWSLSTELPQGSPARRELDAYLDALIESPGARLRRGQDRFRRGRQEAGMADVRAAMALDPLSAAMPETLGLMLSATGDTRAAAEQFEKAAQLAPADAEPPYHAALAWVELGERTRAEAMFRAAVQRNADFARAWYNLGLLLNQAGRRDEALKALRNAETAGPQDADIPYATATILAQAGRREEALAAARRALAIKADYAPARRLIELLGSDERSEPP